jgi:tight adherence protein C
VPLAALPLAAALPGRLALIVLVAAAAAGWLVPDLWLRRRARARAQVMEAELPDVLDLLRVAVEAGLPASRAPREVARHHPGLLARELGEPRASTRSACRARSRSRRSPGARRCPACARLVAAIGRADRHGAPLGPALSALATQARTDRARAAREAAARAAPKVQLVVAALLVPGAMLLIASVAAGRSHRLTTSARSRPRPSRSPEPPPMIAVNASRYGLACWKLGSPAPPA